MSTYIFDVDGVLTNTSCPLDDEFKQWFVNWSSNKRYILVTGSDLDRLKEQVGEDIIKNSYINIGCAGNSINFSESGATHVINKVILNDYETRVLHNELMCSLYPERTGNHIVTREGSVNFSVVGRNATPEQRKSYKEWDEQTNERLQILKRLQSRLDRFDFYLGGDISIDITLRGANKALCLQLINQLKDFMPVYFFGDKTGEYGIDKPLFDAVIEYQIGKAFTITGGYKHTKEILESL